MKNLILMIIIFTAGCAISPQKELVIQKEFEKNRCVEIPLPDPLMMEPPDEESSVDEVISRFKLN